MKNMKRMERIIQEALEQEFSTPSVNEQSGNSFKRIMDFIDQELAAGDVTDRVYDMKALIEILTARVKAPRGFDKPHPDWIAIKKKYDL